MKKIILILAALLVFFSACNNTANDPSQINIIMPNGAPALVFAKMMSENTQYEGFNINYDVVPGVDGIMAKLNQFDIAVVPTNIAANLYNKGEKIKLLSVNVHGVLYMVGKEEITNLNDLKGKTVYNIGQGGTPDLTFRKILQNADIKILTNGTTDVNKVTLEFVQDAATVIPMLLTNMIDYAILGEPVVTQVLQTAKNDANADNDNLKVVLNIQDEWKTATGQTSDFNYPQVSVIAKQALIDTNPELITKILKELNEVSAWILENTESAKTAISNNGGNLPILNAESIERSNIGFLSAQDAKISVTKYLEVIMTFSPASIGGKLPDNNFYYGN